MTVDYFETLLQLMHSVDERMLESIPPAQLTVLIASCRQLEILFSRESLYRDGKLRRDPPGRYPFST